MKNKISNSFTWVTVFVLFAVLVLPTVVFADDEGSKKDDRRGWLHGLHVGATHPLGSLNDFQDSNVHFRMNAGYAFSEKLSVMAYVGFSQFTEDKSADDVNYYWFNASVNVKVVLITTSSGVSYFFQGGPGIYVPKSHEDIPLDTTFGFNAGIGSQVPIRWPFHIEWGMYYHHTNLFKSEQPKYGFLTFHLGVIYIW
jgi:hypothetical protein